MPRLANQTLPSRSHRLCAVNSGTALGEESDAQPANTESTVRTAASVILLSATLPFTGTPPGAAVGRRDCRHQVRCASSGPLGTAELDRKSTRLNSSHTVISYAVFCLKKKKKKKNAINHTEQQITTTHHLHDSSM